MVEPDHKPVVCRCRCIDDAIEAVWMCNSNAARKGIPVGKLAVSLLRQVMQMQLLTISALASGCRSSEMQTAEDSYSPEMNCFRSCSWELA